MSWIIWTAITFLLAALVAIAGIVFWVYRMIGPEGDD